MTSNNSNDNNDEVPQNNLGEYDPASVDWDGANQQHDNVSYYFDDNGTQQNNHQQNFHRRQQHNGFNGQQRNPNPRFGQRFGPRQTHNGRFNNNNNNYNQPNHFDQRFQPPQPQNQQQQPFKPSIIVLCSGCSRSVEVSDKFRVRTKVIRRSNNSIQRRTRKDIAPSPVRRRETKKSRRSSRRSLSPKNRRSRSPSVDKKITRSRSPSVDKNNKKINRNKEEGDIDVIRKDDDCSKYDKKFNDDTYDNSLSDNCSSDDNR